MEFIDILGKELELEVKKEFHPLQEGDVVSTYADTSDLQKEVGYKPTVSIENGVKQFVDWYKTFYQQ